MKRLLSKTEANASLPVPEGSCGGGTISGGAASPDCLESFAHRPAGYEGAAASYGSRSLRSRP
jgi:hypothetical protein